MSLQAFLAALERADPNALCTPPGMGLIRVRHLRSGLLRRVLVVHHSGELICYAPAPKAHGACEHCAVMRALCSHCACSHCTWQREADELGGPHVTRGAIDALLAQMESFRFGHETVTGLE